MKLININSYELASYWKCISIQLICERSDPIFK